MIVLKGMAGMSGFYLEPDETRFHNALSLLGLPVEYWVHAARYVEATLHWIMVCLLLIWVVPTTTRL